MESTLSLFGLLSNTLCPICKFEEICSNLGHGALEGEGIGKVLFNVKYECRVGVMKISGLKSGRFIWYRAKCKL